MQVAKTIDKQITKSEKWIALQYKTALKETRSKLALIYEKYSVAGKLSYADMAKYGRLTQLEGELITVFGEAQTRVTGRLASIPKSVYTESYALSAYNLELASGTKVNWGLIPKEAVTAAGNNPLDLIARNSLSQDMRTRIRREVTQGVIQGRSYADMAKGIKAAYNSTASKATVIARTEGQRAMADGQRFAYQRAEKQGIKVRLFWDAYLDNRTRDAHALMNGVEAQMHNGELMFYYAPTGQWVKGPMDPTLPAEDVINCRCAIREELADEPVGQGQDISYEEWRAGQRF